MRKYLEEELINKSKLGDHLAFRDLIQIYRRRLYSYLMKYSYSRGNTDDLFQEVIIKVWNNLSSYKMHTNFSSWFFTIAHNTAIDNVRKINFINKMNIDIKDINLTSPNDPIKNIESKELADNIMNIVYKLPEKQRDVYLLRVHSSLSFKEIATITNEPLNIVISHMNYAVNKIRKQIKENDGR